MDTFSLVYMWITIIGGFFIAFLTFFLNKRLTKELCGYVKKRGWKGQSIKSYRFGFYFFGFVFFLAACWSLYLLLMLYFG